MSDEIHMEAAWRHRDLAAVEQWHGLAPDEALMAAEEYEEINIYDRVALLRVTMVYLFSDKMPEHWEMVAMRCYAMMHRCLPGTLLLRGKVDHMLLREAWIKRQDGGTRFELNFFLHLCEAEGEDFRKILGEVMDYIFPNGKTWMLKGCQRAYLLALAYQPTSFGQRVTLEDLAQIFDNDLLATRKARDRARSRWSARAQEVLRKPIEAAGGTVRVQFSKSAGARAKMSESARGNRNRRND